MKTKLRIPEFVLAILVLLPFGLLIFLSLVKSWFFPEIIPQKPTLEAWAGILSADDFIILLLKSIALSLSVAIMATVPAFFISKSLASYVKKEVLYNLAYLPYSFSPVIYAFCIQFLFIRTGLKGSYAGVFLAQILISFPFAMLLFSKHWNRDLQNLETLSLSLGATIKQSYVKVILPQSSGIIKLALIQTFLISWFDYGISWVLGGGATNTMMLKIYQYISEANIAYAAVASMMLLIPPVFIIFVQHKLSSNVA